ncbi:MAG: gluconeogenesis factor YvcK family protein [bacterium]
MTKNTQTGSIITNYLLIQQPVAEKIKRKKIVTITGGTGGFALLSGLKKYPFDISAIVSMMDNGGSSGTLRKELGVLPAGDARQCLAAILDDSSEVTKNLMNYRFESGALKGHNFGNIFLSALEKVSGGFNAGIEEAVRMLNISNQVVPVTEGDTQIYTKLKSGKILKGEDELDHNKEIKKIGIENIYLKLKVTACKKAIEKIKSADFVIIGPADFYAGIVCNLLVGGIADAIKNSKAKVIFVCNLTNKKGQTEGFGVDDYVERINNYLGKDRVDYVVFNTKKPSSELIKRYERVEGKNSKVLDTQRGVQHLRAKVIKADLLDDSLIKKDKFDAIARTRSFIRHDSKKLGKVLAQIIK